MLYKVLKIIAISLATFVFILGYPNRVFASCSGNNFSFGTWSDNYSGSGESGLQFILNEMARLAPDLQFVTTAGDTQSYAGDANSYGWNFPGPYTRVDTMVSRTLAGKEKCGATSFPLFRAVGNHEFDDPGYLSAYSTKWAANWSIDPATSKLATQLPGVANFKSGPANVRTLSGSKAVTPGTIYSFDYQNAHLLFINAYEQNVRGDSDAGVWDVNGAGVNDPTNSQLDWIKQDLQQTTKSVKFVFTHPALLAPIYSYNNPPPGWSEHNSDFHTTELTQLLADANVTAYFFGHDHVVSRRLVDRNRNAVCDRLNLDPVPTPSECQSLQGPGKVWQIDSGRVYNDAGSFVLTTVTDASVAFSIYTYSAVVGVGRNLTLWDTWTVPFGGGPVPPSSPTPTPTPTPPTTPRTLYVDQLIANASCATYSPSARNCGAGNTTAYKTIKDATIAAAAGDTVLIRAGTFTETLIPRNSGTAGNYITYRNYGSEVVTIQNPPFLRSQIAAAAEETGPSDDAYGVYLYQKSYIWIEGIRFSNMEGWLRSRHSNNNVIKGNTFTVATLPGSSAGLKFMDSHDNRILNNTISDGNDNMMLVDSNRNLVQGNTFTKARHVLFNISCGNNNIVRANRFTNTTQKATEVFDCEGIVEGYPLKLDATKYNVIEGNTFDATAPNDGGGPYNSIQFGGQNTIIRNNVFSDSQGGALSFALYPQEALHTKINRAYNNTFYGNKGGGTGTDNVAGDDFADNILKNNIYYKNTPMPIPTNDNILGGSQVTNRTASGYRFENNNILSINPGDLVIQILKQNKTLAQAQSQYAGLYAGNVELNPGFVNEGENGFYLASRGSDFHLVSTSPMIDRGAFLTATVGGGSGTSMKVVDVGYFSNGNSIAGETGDLIQLAGQTSRARVVAVDYINKILILDQPLSWQNNQGVSLAYEGNAPDIGAYEFTGTPTLQPTPLNITFRPRAEGLDDLKSVTFTFRLFQSGSSFPQATFTGSGSALKLPANVTLTPGSYDIDISAPYYLRKRQSALSFANGADFTLNALPSGDLNQDQIINSLDWSIMNPKWFTNDAVADLNKDGIVNSIDFSLMNRNWGRRGE